MIETAFSTIPQSAAADVADGSRAAEPGYAAPTLPQSAEESDSTRKPDLNELLQHPAIWRGRSIARVQALSTGYEALDAALPGAGWPRSGLVEILIPRLGAGELYVLLPALAALTSQHEARWCAWITPPLVPYAPALTAHGVALDRVFVVQASEPLWAFEQCLVSGACDAVLGWALHPQDQPHARYIRRLQLAAEKGHALGVLFRPCRAAREASSAVLRITVEPLEQGARVALLKSRGGQRGAFDLTWNNQNENSPRAHGS
jgi:hypothetical protein